MIGPCMCGDYCCSSCGPAQGNFRCPVCRAWASDGCECTPEQVEAAQAAERAADDAHAEAVREDARLAEEWREEQGMSRMRVSVPAASLPFDRVPGLVSCLQAAGFPVVTATVRYPITCVVCGHTVHSAYGAALERGLEWSDVYCCGEDA
jgi:hypothetical protein